MIIDEDDGPLLSLSDLAALYEREHVAMVRLAYLLTGSHSLAEEAAHDTFISVFKHRATIKRPGAYLRTSVVNRCNTMQRRRATEQRKLIVVATTTAREVELAPELDEMWRLLHRLTANQRTALVLRFYQDLTIDQIATAMEERPGTVKSLIHRGLARLRKEIEP
ncbi:MAG: sigma-70 family RNA polymerase sigma factor [Actinomycetia bacterium]|nr:sigma-70 family RNA polymerase sigma factor [Actinomycetes bacterium]